MQRSYSIPYTFSKGNELRIDNLIKAPESYKDNFSLSIQESEYTEDENGVRKFFIKGTASSRLGKRHTQQYVSNMAWAVSNFETLSGKVTYMTKEATPAPSTTWSITVSGIENLPDEIMKVRLIVRADGIGGSNLVTIEKKLISNISDKVRLERESQNHKNQEITFNEQINSGDFNETPITDVNSYSGCSECTGTDLGTGMTEYELGNKPLNNNMKIVGITALGVIGLLLYSKGGLK